MTIEGVIEHAVEALDEQWQDPDHVTQMYRRFLDRVGPRADAGGHRMQALGQLIEAHSSGLTGPLALEQSPLDVLGSDVPCRTASDPEIFFAESPADIEAA